MKHEKKMSPAKQRANNRLKKNLDINLGEYKAIKCDTTLEDYYDNILPEEVVNRSVAEYEDHMRKVLDDFCDATSLNQCDVSILFLATALQIARQYLVSNEKYRLSNSENEAIVKKPLKKLGFDRIIQPVPYDATHYVDGKQAFKERTGQSTHGLSGANHRSMTLGHDPIFGWIFGTMNILTETLTKNNILLESYSTIRNGDGGYKIHDLTNIGLIAKNSIDSVSEHPTNLLIAVATQAVHINTDLFTKLGLPLPIINNISPEFAQMLQRNGIDVYSVSRGAALSVLINKIISCIHLLFYDENTDLKLYEVNTKKILMLSNTIASSSNIIYTAITKDLKKLDVGGLCVTLYHLFTDPKFIDSVKYEYLNSEVSKIYREKLERIESDFAF